MAQRLACSIVGSSRESSAVLAEVDETRSGKCSRGNEQRAIGARRGQPPPTAIPGAVSDPEPRPPPRRSLGGIQGGKGATGSLVPEKQGSLPRVLLVTDSMSWGGAERHVVDLAIALSSRGYEILVACSAGGPLARELHQAGIPIRVLGGRL